MDGDVEHYISQLKQVFEACDQNGDGFVKTQDLLRLGEEHSNDDGFHEIRNLVEKLDPEGHGKISFEEFCHGVHDFLGSNGEAGYGDSLPVQENLVTEIEQVGEDTSYERDSTYSTTSTNDYCGDDDDDDDLQPSHFERNVRQYSTFPPPNGPRTKNKFSPPAVLVDRSCTSETSEYQSEEGQSEELEGYGEGFDSETTFESSQLSVRHRPRSRHSRPVSSTPKGRLSSLISAAGTASHMHKSHSANASWSNSLEDLFGENRALSDSEACSAAFLLSEIRRLSSQVSLLQEDHECHVDKQVKAKEENKQLTMRINALEEQLENQNLSAGVIAEEEGRRYKNALSKLERDNEESLEILNRKLHQAQEEIEKLKFNEPMLRKELEACQDDKRLLKNRIEELQAALASKNDEVLDLRTRIEHHKEEVEEERQHHDQELNALTMQVLALERFKEEADTKLRDVGNLEQSKSDLEKHVQQLIKENINLKSTKEELKVQLTQNGHFMAEQQNSLADEPMSANKDKVISALREQEDENRRLRSYLDGLLMIIMEHNPQLLEVM